jgi:hypothetical protein
MSIHSIRTIVRSQARAGLSAPATTSAAAAARDLTASERAALRTAARRARRASNTGKAIEPPTGAVMWM